MTDYRAPSSLQKALARRSWAKVIQIICSLPPDQGLIHQSQVLLAMAHLEKRETQLALKVISKAMLSEPYCPMVYWALGNAMQQGGEHREAIHAYVTTVSIIGSPDCPSCCVRHRAKAKGLVADTLLHSYFSYKALGENAKADAVFERHLSFRGPGCFSIYRLQELPENIEDLRTFRAVG